MNKFITTNVGGHDFCLDDIRFNDTAYRDAFNSILKAFGNNFIVHGCEVNGVNIAAGYVMLNGEFLKVDAHQRTGDYYQKVTTYDPAGNVTYQNGQTHDVYEINRAVCSAGAGPLAYNGRRIFGNTAGQACEGNDARLSDSRQCNNNFDNAATARANLSVYSIAEVNQKISDLVNGAPGALDTLYEIATALGNDPNLSATLLNAISNEATARANAITAEATARANVDAQLQQQILDVYQEVNTQNPDNLITRYFQIGAWNCQADQTKEIAISTLGIDASKIIGVRAYIMRDYLAGANNLKKDINGAGRVDFGEATTGNVIFLVRNSGSTFDSSNYSRTDVNRGFLLIELIP